MGDYVHMTCGQCSRSWWSEPDKHLTLLALKLRRRRRSRGVTGPGAARNGVGRCPSCYSTQVAPSATAEAVPPIIDLTAASTVIWLDGLPGKEADDLVRSGTLTSAAAHRARLARQTRATGSGSMPE